VAVAGLVGRSHHRSIKCHVSKTSDTGHSDPFQRKCAGVPSAARITTTGWPYRCAMRSAPYQQPGVRVSSHPSPRARDDYPQVRGWNLPPNGHTPDRLTLLR